jgi:very-short-patch-repair endonuclease
MGRTLLYDTAAMAALVAQQDGLITRSQAFSCGLTKQALRVRLREGGAWRVIVPGVYATFTGAVTPKQKEVTALLYAGPSKIGELRYVPIARAVADAARQLPDMGEVRALVASAVQWRKISVAALADELEQGPSSGSARFRAVLLEVADGIRSAAEGDLRKLIKRSGLPDPLYNPRLYVGEEFIAMPDAWWPEASVAVEVDSKQWHLSPADWEQTMARHSRMSALGITVLHYPPSRLHAEPRAVVTEISSALEIGRSRPRLPIRTEPAT